MSELREIILRTDGEKYVKAALCDPVTKHLIKGAEAKCSPEDTFDFEVGAHLAIERLFSEETTVGGKRLKVRFTRHRTKVTMQVLMHDGEYQGGGLPKMPSVTSPGAYYTNDHASVTNFETEEEAINFIVRISEFVAMSNREPKAPEEAKFQSTLTGE